MYNLKSFIPCAAVSLQNEEYFKTDCIFENGEFFFLYGMINIFLINLLEWETIIILLYYYGFIVLI